MLIGISGVARSGKDTFGRFLVEKLEGRTMLIALAKKLKDETQPIIQSNFGLNVWTNESAEKEVFRDFLVAWGKMRRKQTNGRYFIDHAQSVMDKVKDCYENFAITDIRYAEYEEDELPWIEKNGILVHVRKQLADGSFQLPANLAEAENDSILQQRAAYRIVWPETGADVSKCEPFIDKFIEWLKTQPNYPVKTVKP